MRRLLLVTTLIVANLGVGLAQNGSKAVKAARPRPIVVAFFDEERLQHPAGRAALRDFEYYFSQIHGIVERDFPNVQLRILARGELVYLPDGSALNVQNMRPEIGYVLATPGKKHRLLTGVQTEADFACAAATFYQRPSSACPK